MKFIVYRTSAGGPYPLDETPYPPPCEGTRLAVVRHEKYPTGRPLHVNIITFHDMQDFVQWGALQGCPVIMHSDEHCLEEGSDELIPVLEIRDQRE
jgi:hypothetical protein